MGNGNCYLCGKEIEVDEKLDDTLSVEVEGQDVADNERDAGEVLLCTACQGKFQKEAEKMKGKK